MFPYLLLQLSSWSSCQTWNSRPAMRPSQQHQKCVICIARVLVYAFLQETLQVTEWIHGEKTKTTIRNKHKKCKSTTTLPAVQNCTW